MAGQFEVVPLKLTSLLLSSIRESGTQKARAEQWAGTIRNMQNRGVSAAEIEWSGVLDYLAGMKDCQVSRNQIIDFLEGTGVCDLSLKRCITERYSPTLRYRKFPRPQKMPPYVIVNGRRELQLIHYTEGSFGLAIWLHLEVDNGLFGRHCYWSMAIPRGRRKLGAERGKRRFASVKAAMSYGAQLIGRFTKRLEAEGFIGKKQPLGLYRRYALPGGMSYSEWLLCADRFPDIYSAGHFDTENIVAHIRTTEWAGEDGSKFLLLEEIQSDWNQSLRASLREMTEENALLRDQIEMLPLDSVDAPPPMNPYLNHWLDAALRAMLLLAAENGLSGVGWLPGRFHLERYADYDNEGLSHFYDQLVPAAAKKLARSWGVETLLMKFQTYSRSLNIGYRHSEKVWFIRSRTNGKLIEDGFRCYEDAEVVRLRLEKPVHERVPFIPIGADMRADLNSVGMPFLGAVGNRPAKVRDSKS
jgi:hypothetical protein